MTDKGGGGGSGGSIWITASTLSGTGSITSRGGYGSRYRTYSPYLRYYYAGGGGGGRIALYYNIKTYSGATSVNGGTGSYEAGQPGTIENSTSPEQVYGPIKQTYSPIPSDLSGYENIVFITHGWNGITGIGNHGWIDVMAGEFQFYFVENGMSDTWTSYAYYWEEYAGEIDLPPDSYFWDRTRAILMSLETSRGNAMKIGSSIGTQLADLSNCKHIHLISHSAGSWMIDAISEKIKSTRPDISIQITFLDTYTPGGKYGVDTLGEHGDWVEHYVDSRNDFSFEFININLTNGTLDNAYNTDVTCADSDSDNVWAHAWPIDWYILTIPDLPPLDYISRGFTFSLEGGVIPSLEEMQQNYPRGEREIYPPDCEPPPSKNPIKVLASVAIDWLNNTLNYSSPSDVEFDETQVTINSGEAVQTLQTISLNVTATEATGTMPSDISWFSITIDANESVNALSFDSEFTSLAGAESILEVYWEDQLIGSIDERYVFDGIQEYIYFLPEIYQPGSYKLAFKLATYNNTASSIEIDNFRLKLYRASCDLYPDNKIDLLDFAILAEEWSIQKRPEDLAPEEGDGIVNLLDFAVLASSWGQEPSQDMEKLKDISENWLTTYKLPISDIAPYPNGDGLVDILDLQVLAENWLEGTSSKMDTNDINEGLVTYYKFDGTSGPVIDETGTNDASNVNDNATRGVTGKVGNAFEFNGINSWVESDFSTGITGNSDWTISFWVYYADDQINATNIISLGTAGYLYQNKIISISAGYTATDLMINIWSHTDNEWFDIDIDLTDSWNHIAATYNGTNLELFVNGISKKTKPVILDLMNDKIRIAGVPGGDDSGDVFFNGMIDEVKIWNRTLSASEVQYLFQNP